MTREAESTGCVFCAAVAGEEASLVVFRGSVAFIDDSPEMGKPLGDRGRFQVRAADRIPQVEQHLGDAAHTDAPDSGEVQMLWPKKHFL